MNYYPHNIGDYDSHTAHLSWLEDCAYRRLLCLYYRTEKPLPDFVSTCRLVRAASKHERAAVQTVLNEFFSKEDDGWHHARCDSEIKIACEKREIARINGTKGGRPARVPANQEGTNREPSGLFLGIPERTHAKAPNPNPNPKDLEPPDGGPVDPDPPEPDPRKQLFDLGKTVLGRTAGGLISAAISRTSEAQVGKILGELAVKPMADAKAYFVKATTPKERGVVF